MVPCTSERVSRFPTGTVFGVTSRPETSRVRTAETRPRGSRTMTEICVKTTGLSVDGGNGGNGLSTRDVPR